VKPNDEFTQQTIRFDEPVMATAVELHPQSWEGNVSMRAGLLVGETYTSGEECAAAVWEKWGERVASWYPTAGDCWVEHDHSAEGSTCAATREIDDS
jgi:hypothetical protein